MGTDGEAGPPSQPTANHGSMGQASWGVASTSNISGVGVDIQQISELFPEQTISPKSDATLTAIFSLQELSYAEGADNSRQTLAGIFAAKEAIIKSDSSVANTDLRAIEVLPNDYGVPAHEGYLLSISHSGDFAVAIAARVNAIEPIDDGEDDSAAVANRAATVATKSRSKQRPFHWPIRAIMLLGTIGGLWLLVDKLRALF